MAVLHTRRSVIRSAGLIAGAAFLAPEAASAAPALEHHKIWAITAYVHFDRTASPWVVKRFIDPEAEFVFVHKGETPPAGAIQLAIPGSELGPHDEHGTTFDKILAKYKLDDPALHLIARVVDAGVNYVLHGTMPAPDDKYGAMAFGLLAIANGMPLVKNTDAENLQASFVNWDAIYAEFKSQELVQAKGLSLPDPKLGAGARIDFLRGVLKSAKSDG